MTVVVPLGAVSLAGNSKACRAEMAKKSDVTYSGHRPDQVRSALQKAIRRGQVDDALHWLTELVLSGEEWWAWRTLLVITSEDVGPAWLEGPA